MKLILICLTIIICVWMICNMEIEVKVPQFYRITNAIEFPQLNKKDEQSR